MGLRAKTSNTALNGDNSKHSAAASGNNRTAGTLLTKVLSPCLNCKNAVAATTCCSITSIRTTYRSSSTSALMTTNKKAAVAATTLSSSSSSANSMRPQTLNVRHHPETPTDHTQSFLGEVPWYW